MNQSWENGEKPVFVILDCLVHICSPQFIYLFLNFTSTSSQKLFQTIILSNVTEN